MSGSHDVEPHRGLHVMFYHGNSMVMATVYWRATFPEPNATFPVNMAHFSPQAYN